MLAHDIVIRGATVYDGTGASGVAVDVALRGDRIAAVGAIAERGGREINGRGLVLAPGFIDVHSHDDLAVLIDPDLPFKVMQGVTTDIVGNCGFGVAPFDAALQQFAAVFDVTSGAALTAWDGHAGYLERVEAARPSCNVAVLMGHGTLRRGATGSLERAPTSIEVDRMRAWVREGIEAGALGMSTGLVYEPGRYAPTEELVTMARAMGPGTVYATHMRSDGAQLLEAVAEAIHIGREARVGVQISHHKASGRANWGRVRDSLRLIEEARAAGLDVTADQYPYVAASSSLFAVWQNGSFARGVLTGSDVLIASAPRHPEWEGQRLDELARTWGSGIAEAVARILEDEGKACVVVMFTMDDGDVRTVMAHPTTMIGSDGIPAGGRPHPRLYGTFARVLGQYVRDLGVLDLATAIHRMTGMPARKFRLEGRGLIRPEAYADLVLFDPLEIEDVATYEEPRRSPSGIKAVIVNGIVVRDGDRHTGARPGRSLRRGRA